MKKYIKYFALIIILLFSLSCAKVAPPKVPKKPSPPIIKKPTKEEILIEEKKPVEPQVPEEESIIEEPAREEILIEEKKPVESQILEEESIIEEPELEKEREKKQVKGIKPEKRIIPILSVMLPNYFNEKDGSDMALVRGGHFIMGDSKGEKNERPAVEEYVPAFYIDMYEITNKQYRLFNDEFVSSSANDCDLCPVTGVTWEEAESYCRWAGKRLPTEAEWEKTARGSQQLKWPWGKLPQENRANVLANPESQSDEKHYTGPVPVGSYPQGASVFGVFDMAGNIWEWTDSLYLPYKNNSNPDIRYQKQYRVLRGGSWKNTIENARTTFRHPVSPDTRLPNIGFRCVKDVDKYTTHSIQHRNH